MRLSRVRLRGRIFPAHFFCSIVFFFTTESGQRHFGSAATDWGKLSGTDVSTGQASTEYTRLGWRGAIQQTVTGLGYELVDVERSARGLLRVFIDRLPGRSYASGDGEFVTVDDCEQVTRQLQYALEVETVAYERLEVSSPGLDRPLKRESDYERFAGQEINLTLKLPFQGRKVWKGLLARDDKGWNLVLDEGKTGQVLNFTLEEVREARLVPVVNFKGRPSRKADAEMTEANGEVGGQER
jgi:ribosome maturation factor RimP